MDEKSSGSLTMYVFLDKFFFVFHSCLILFILFGWLWKKTRKANLALILLTAFSWFILGIWYGYGYCPCTDWHWKVRFKLGIATTQDSYIEFLIETFTGLDVSRTLVDVIALIFLIAAFLASIATNFLDWKKKKKGGRNART
ncbi:MAG: DUF2784 domain-containing protein [Candidatus Aminicenantes bacterium]|jgi:hypothetical protein